MSLQPLPAFADNYIWTLSADGGDAVIVDPSEAAPVFTAADAGLRPAMILLTHHHADHIGGCAALLQRWPGLPVFAPMDERIDLPCTRVGEGARVEHGRWRFEVLEIPGHTRSHVAFHGHGLVFCGDTLFSLGCGRMFEGTAEQMLGSLDRLAALPAETLVCCGHEYTLANAAFAAAADADNPALRERSAEAANQRERGLPTLPATIAGERAANPFLRVDSAAIQGAIAARLGRAPRDRVETFAELRRWKDGFSA
ncbi:hydroxyacylglutathione hydrolase [Luteimonas sp. 8-5]|uniref:hydroxyacylglutathione hydrolase n=1 Tax=Luteimonas sp. 8-5 TaxID=3039387 RepID=UPI002436E6A5|nr:hydroxyacylglutathione hydrolase [Luteimonas sp. 8-5]MDG6349173.1 hydroxyacylglutathione hydrolase [Luteimonas sp. 8-5]